MTRRLDRFKWAMRIQRGPRAYLQGTPWASINKQYNAVKTKRIADKRKNGRIRETEWRKRSTEHSRLHYRQSNQSFFFKFLCLLCFMRRLQAKCTPRHHSWKGLHTGGAKSLIVGPGTVDYRHPRSNKKTSPHATVAARSIKILAAG